MRPSTWRHPAVLAAAGAVSGAATLLILAVTRAASLEPAGAGLRSAPNPPVTAVPTDTAHAEQPDFMIAVENDPFLPERTAKPTRNRPGEPKQSADSLILAAVPHHELIVLGVAVLPGGGGVAASRLGDESRLVRIGQQIGPYRLLRVEAGRAVFEGQNGVARTITVRKPES